MKKRRSAEQIEGSLQQADADLWKGMTMPDVCRRLGITQQTYSAADRAPPRSGGRGGMDPKMAKQLQELDVKSSRLMKRWRIKPWTC